MKKETQCCICLGKLENEFGNNAWPLKTNEGERCCNICNDMFVIQARLARMAKRKANEKTVGGNDESKNN